jgi:hypothetical protein
MICKPFKQGGNEILGTEICLNLIIYILLCFTDQVNPTEVGSNSFLYVMNLSTTALISILIGVKVFIVLKVSFFELKDYFKAKNKEYKEYQKAVKFHKYHIDLEK